MADRVSASITIGGVLSAADYDKLVELIAEESLSTEWDGDPFSPDQRERGKPLSLYAHEVPWGRFDSLEAWCLESNLPFARWSGAYPGQWGAERAVSAGSGEVQLYPADEEDYVLIGREKVMALGTFDAVVAYFDAADLVLPALVVDGEDLDHASDR